MRYQASLVNFARTYCNSKVLGSPNTVIGKNPVDLVFEARWLWSNQTTNLSTFIEDNESRNSLNMVLKRNVLVLVSIQLGKIEFPLVLIAQFLEYRRNSATGTTPCSPKINDNGFVRFEYLCLEILVSYIQEVFLRVR